MVGLSSVPPSLALKRHMQLSRQGLPARHGRHVAFILVVSASLEGMSILLHFFVFSMHPEIESVGGERSWMMM